MRDVGVASIFLNAEHSPAIAGNGEKTIGAGRKRVDDVIFAGPEFAGRLTILECVDFGSIRKGSAGVDRADRGRLNNRDGGGSYPLHRKRGQGVVRFVAYVSGVDGTGGVDGNRCNLAARRFEQHIAFAFGTDAIDKTGAVGAGDQVSFRVPRQGANVGFVALEELFRRRAWM